MIRPPLYRITIFLITLVIQSISFLVHAQEPGTISFERLPVDLNISNTTTSVIQDHTGFIWIGTQEGLYRYDGNSSRHFTQENSNLADDFINILYEDHTNVLWIGTRAGGIHSLDLTNGNITAYIHMFENQDTLNLEWVETMSEDQDGMVWIGTLGGGLSRFDRTTGQFDLLRHDPEISDSLASDIIRAIHPSVAEPGVLWIGTERGLSWLELETAQFKTFPLDLSNSDYPSQPAIRVIFEDHDGHMWVGTDDDGIYVIRPGPEIIRHYESEPNSPNSLSSNYITAIYEEPNGIFWIGTYDGGLNRLDLTTERFTRYTNDPGDNRSLPHNQIKAIYSDHSDVLWISTWGGLAKYIPQRFEHYTHLSGTLSSLSSSEVTSIQEDDSELLWIGTVGGGLNRLDRRTGQITHFSLPFSDVIAITEDRFGSLWLGTRADTLYRFDRDTYRVTPYPLGAPGSEHPDDIVLTIYEAPSQTGILWIGTSKKGLYAFDVDTRQTIRDYPPDPADSSSISSEYAWPIFEDSTGELWIGTWGGGLNQFDRETERFKRYPHNSGDPNSISNDRVISIHEDKTGTLWFGTWGGGLNKYDRSTGQFLHYTEEHGLPDDNIVGILSDQAGTLWLSTNNGLSNFNPKTEHFINYGIADGLQDREYRIGASHKNENGELFFGGRNGLNVFHPDSVRSNLHVPRVVLTDFLVFEESAKLDVSAPYLEEIVLLHDENYLTFTFAALDYTDPSRNRYRYRLEGLEEDWIDAGNQGRARYPGLRPGQYTFRARGSNNHGIWNEEGLSIDVIIRAPWWLRWWAYTLYGLLLAAGIYAIDRARRNRLAVRLKAQSAEEHARVLEQLDRMKSSFFVNISHEFRTPLTLILGPLQDALSGLYGPVNDQLNHQLGLMRRSGTRLLRLINQLLDLSKLESGSMHLRAREADLAPFLHEIVLSFASRAERKNITLQYEAPVNPVLLYFEPDKMEKIVSNLLSNAFKFTQASGKIRVSVTPGADESGDFVEITVKDTGQGIPAAEQPHIFDRFHQVDASLVRKHEGTGIGLALVKELVELHGGLIRLESEEGFGSTFFVRLRRGKDHLPPDDVVEEPLDEEPIDTESLSLKAQEEEILDEMLPSEPSSSEAPEDAPVVLIVDDNADVRAYLKSHLAALYRIEEAGDGLEGLAKAREVTPVLILSDVMMPEMDGYELCRAVKEDQRLNHIPVILLTAKATEDSKVTGYQLGADDYIYKPFNADTLLTRVENLIEIRRRLRQRFSEEVIVQPSGISVPSAEAAFLEQVRSVVEAHLDDSNFGVDWLAGEVGLSTRQLQRRIKASTNLSAAGFIREMRLERAAQLLSQQAGTVSEIAYQVGFKSPANFSRLFTSIFGVPPSKYMSE